MFRSDSSGYGSLGGDHLSLDDHSLSNSALGHYAQGSCSDSTSVGKTSISPNPAYNDRNFSVLFSQDLTPNKRAIMEAMLTHWIANPSDHKISKPVLSAQTHSVSSVYPSSVRSSVSPSIHSTERHAS